MQHTETTPKKGRIACVKVGQKLLIRRAGLAVMFTKGYTTSDSNRKQQLQEQASELLSEAVNRKRK